MSYKFIFILYCVLTFIQLSLHARFSSVQNMLFISCIFFSSHIKMFISIVLIDIFYISRKVITSLAAKTNHQTTKHYITEPSIHISSGQAVSVFLPDDFRSPQTLWILSSLGLNIFTFPSIRWSLFLEIAPVTWRSFISLHAAFTFHAARTEQS